MTEGNIPGSDRKKQLLPYLLPDMLNTYQREIKLFELSQDANWKELKVRKNQDTLQWPRCNGLLYNGFIAMPLKPNVSLLPLTYVYK